MQSTFDVWPGSECAPALHIHNLNLFYLRLVGQGIQKWTKKNCGRQALKNSTWSILEYLLPDKSKRSPINDQCSPSLVVKGVKVDNSTKPPSSTFYFLYC